MSNRITQIKNNNGVFHYLNDKFDCHHREDGPAIELSNGSKFWFVCGKRHRVNGPAVELSNGEKKYYLLGEEYSFEEWDRLRKLPYLF